MTERQPPDSIGDRAAAAAYVADLTGELARIARRHGLDTLGYLLDIARLEADIAAGGDRARGHPGAGRPR